MPPTAGSSTADAEQQPRFYYDLASPESYLVAERALHALDAVPEWIPVSVGEVGPFRCAEEVASYKEDLSRRAQALGLMPLRWPEPWPGNTLTAMRAAVFAKQTGRAVAFSLAAFRQAFAGGRDLGERDSVLIAAAACEMHPAAVVKGAGLGSIAARLETATAEAAAAGVLDVPALVLDGGRVFHGDRELERAAAVRAA